MEARSNSLFCAAHLLEACHEDFHTVQHLCPTVVPQLPWVCDELQQQLACTGVDNIQRSMKLNLLYVASMLAPMVPALFALEEKLATFLTNAAYYLPLAEDGVETVRILHGLGRFIERVVREGLGELQPSNSSICLISLSKLVSLLGKKVIRQAIADEGAVGQQTWDLWMTILHTLLLPSAPRKLFGNLRYGSVAYGTVR
jgi:hypothetical protein